MSDVLHKAWWWLLVAVAVSAPILLLTGHLY